MTRLGAALRALRRRRWDDIRDVGEAQVALLRAQAMRWLRPLGEFVEITAGDPRTASAHSVAQARTVERVTSAINRATRYGVFRPLCLTRAVALSQMLDSHGIVGHRIKVGVRRDRDSFTAHAWVEFGQRIIGDTTWNTLAYLPLTEISVTGEPALSGIMRHRLHRGPRHPGDRLRWDQ